jgi:uncharacterized membrane protein
MLHEAKKQLLNCLLLLNDLLLLLELILMCLHLSNSSCSSLCLSFLVLLHPLKYGNQSTVGL